MYSQANKEELNINAEQVNITNLTAEIESFVRTADTDQAEIKSKSKSTSQITLKTDDSKHIEKTDFKEEEEKHGKEILRQSPESNDFYSQSVNDDLCEEITIEKIQNLGTIDVNSNERIKRSPVKILVRAPTDEESTNDERELTTQSLNDVLDSKDTSREIIIVERECVLKESMHEESAQIYGEKGESEESKANQDTEGTTTPTSSAVEFILENEIVTDASETTDTLLKITESIVDLTKVETETFVTNYANTSETKKKNSVLERECVPVNESSNIFSQFEVRSIPLKLDSPKIRKRDVAAKREPPTPPQRRRSVKEIIESINKCQSLLKINQGSKAEKDKINTDLFQATYSSSSKSFDSKPYNRNMNDSAEKSYQNKKMFGDIGGVNNNVKTEDMTNIPLFVEKFNEFNNNNPNSIFEKCVTRGDNTDGRVEWNPVPKPRRHRNATQGSIN